MSDPTDNDSQPVTVVVPGPAAAPAQDDSASSRPRGVTLRWLTIGLLSLMLLALVVVVVVLPDLVAERVSREQPPVIVAPPEPVSAVPSADAKRMAREKREAERLLGIVLRKQTELEAEDVAVWGGQDYDAAMDSLAEGDAELHAERYTQAAGNYERAIAEFDALRASMAQRLTAALEAADAGLAAGDGDKARKSFGIALAIEPNNARAQQGMLRARVLEEVVALMAAGAEQEARDALDAAREKYASALALDARSQQARAALDSVTTRIREREFHAAMSVALVALERNDFDASRAALKTAAALEPGSPEVADARRRLQLAVQRSRIGRHRKEAEALERDERWREAGEHYAAVLVIDSNAAFARTGREKSLARARIHSELDAYLSELGRLSAPGPRDNARRLLDAAADLDAESEPKLAAKVGRLTQAIETAEAPMQVRLQSDNLTDVTVYKVGRFGRFATRDLLLPPGTYVAVGTRAGYRDVRIEFTLTAGQEPAFITVRCREKI